MVAGKNHTVGLSDGDPTSGFECLGGFIDK